MQPNPAAGEQSAESSERLVRRAEEPGGEAADGPHLVVRPKVQCLLAGPVLLVLALGAVASGRARLLPIAVVFGLVGIAFLRTWFDRIDLGPVTIRRRSLL